METILNMTIREWSIFLVALIPFAPLVIGIIMQKNDKSHNAIGWFLNFLLDFITALSSNEVGGSFAILLGFSVGSFFMFIILLFQFRIDFGLIEIITIVLIALCILIWNITGAYIAMLAGILSEIIIDFYLLYKTYKKPTVKYNLISYFMFFIVSIITLFTVKNTNIEQTGYPVASSILSLFIIIPLLKKWWQDEKYKEQMIMSKKNKWG